MKERILITVKTYPTLSTKYEETVCTAGLREDGSWVRLYPVPFRKLEEYKKYHKYQWMTVKLHSRGGKDRRPESFVPEIDTIEMGEIISPAHQWSERCRFVLEKGIIYDDMTKLIELANENTLSLATYKPKEILDLIVEPVERNWPKEKLKLLRNKHRQGDLFGDPDQFEKDFKVVEKLPYKFSYLFEDKNGEIRRLMIEDWEIGALYWNCLKKAKGDEQIAIQKVREKYLDDFVQKRDLYLFVGTTLRFHGWTPNPFVIIGTFTPPKNRILGLGL